MCARELFSWMSPTMRDEVVLAMGDAGALHDQTPLSGKALSSPPIPPERASSPATHTWWT